MIVFGCASDSQFNDELYDKITQRDYDLHYCENHDYYYCSEIEYCNPYKKCYPAMEHCRTYRNKKNESI